MSKSYLAPLRESWGRWGRWHWVLLFGVTLALVTRFANDAMILFEPTAPSESTGNYINGHLRNGRRLPTSGPNFRAYSYVGTLLGRNTVNDRVRASVLAAYDEMERARPEVTFVYGETSTPHGGALWPHHSHANGLSVDFFVPLTDATGHSVSIATWPWNAWGYAHRFNDDGCDRDGRCIDYETAALHLLAVDRAARRHRLRIARVFLEPPLVHRLQATPAGSRTRGLIPFYPGRIWFRHDQHYHVDFAIADL